MRRGRWPEGEDEEEEEEEEVLAVKKKRQMTLTWKRVEVDHGGAAGPAAVLALSMGRPEARSPAATARMPPPDVFEYIVGFYEDEEARRLYRVLAALPHWGTHTVRIFDQDRTLRRLTATYALRPHRVARYSETSPGPEPLSAAPAVADILARVQAWAGPAHTVNYVLLNYYRNGNDSVALHGDYLDEMVGPVYSLSFQDTDDPAQLRFFDMVCNATGQKERIRAANGSLMVMQRAFHVLWKHGVPPQREVTAGRINVTCRCVREHDVPPAPLRRAG